MNPIVKEISAIQSNPEDVYVIHYSQYMDENRSHYPRRVSCIYVQNLNGSESQKFSIDKYAVKNDIDLAAIEDWYDDLEIYVLSDFNTFLRTKMHCTFIYWLEEGQELMLNAIQARYEELNNGEVDKSFYVLSSSNKKVIQNLVSKVDPDSTAYTDLKKFIKYHNQDKILPGFLNTAEESVCFDKKDFSKIETSVVVKVSFFVSLINTCSTVESKQKKDPNNDPIDIQSLSPRALLRRLNIKSWAWFIGIIISSFGIGTSLSISQVTQLKNQNTEFQNQLTEAKKQYEDSLRKYSNSNLNLLNQLRLKSDSLNQERRNKTNNNKSTLH
jgi:hypothetical protein